ncbi:hypothetical protein NP233_g13093 [Leucocoprinus birnbaumii]|uniref:Uncharacterized protein n=1 Tax=Leucocoprinus birnbaumii TaxID=56174 RepID=A0AAD5YPB5_9AGAR|nr:hypothetical protein NP233_g13093 [Leucocoprinus birnbaumii]
MLATSVQFTSPVESSAVRVSPNVTGSETLEPSNPINTQEGKTQSSATAFQGSEQSSSTSHNVRFILPLSLVIPTLFIVCCVIAIRYFKKHRTRLCKDRAAVTPFSLHTQDPGEDLHIISAPVPDVANHPFQQLLLTTQHTPHLKSHAGSATAAISTADGNRPPGLYDVNSRQGGNHLEAVLQRLDAIEATMWQPIGIQHHGSTDQLGPILPDPIPANLEQGDLPPDYTSHAGNALEPRSIHNLRPVEGKPS